MSVYTIKSGASAHPEEILLALMSALVDTGGVNNKAQDAFKVDAQSSPDMTVKVQVGNEAKAVAFLEEGNVARPVLLDADENVTISANASGNDRTDAIVCYFDTALAANTSASNIIKFVAVEGTPAASPVAPNDSEVEADIGASNPWIRLANVQVVNGASSISSGNILDKRVEVRMRVLPRSGYQSVAYASNIDIDVADATKYKIGTLTGNITIDLENVKSGDVIILKLLQDGTGGRSITLGGAGLTYNYEDGALDFDDSANAGTILAIIANSDTELDVVVGGDNLS